MDTMVQIELVGFLIIIGLIFSALMFDGFLNQTYIPQSKDGQGDIVISSGINIEASKEVISKFNYGIMLLILLLIVNVIFIIMLL